MVVSDLFGFGDLIGEIIRLNGMFYKVVGVLKEKGVFMMGLSDD